MHSVEHVRPPLRVDVELETYIRRPRPLCARTSSSSIDRYVVATLRHDAGAVWVRRRTAAGDSTGASNSGLSQTPLLEYTQPVSSQAISSQLAPSQPKNRRYNVKWGEGRKWLQYDDVEGVMFCSMCILQCTIK